MFLFSAEFIPYKQGVGFLCKSWKSCWRGSWVHSNSSSFWRRGQRSWQVYGKWNDPEGCLLFSLVLNTFSIQIQFQSVWSTQQGNSQGKDPWFRYGSSMDRALLFICPWFLVWLQTGPRRTLALLSRQTASGWYTVSNCVHQTGVNEWSMFSGVLQHSDWGCSYWTSWSQNPSNFHSKRSSLCYLQHHWSSKRIILLNSPGFNTSLRPDTSRNPGLTVPLMRALGHRKSRAMSASRMCISVTQLGLMFPYVPSPHWDHFPLWLWSLSTGSEWSQFECECGADGGSSWLKWMW